MRNKIEIWNRRVWFWYDEVSINGGSRRRRSIRNQ